MEEESERESEPDSQDIRHPWPYLQELFEVVGSKNDSWRMRCVLCKPKSHEILAFKNSPSNLKKHIERKHSNHVERYKSLTSTTLKRKSVSSEEGSSKQLKLWEMRRCSSLWNKSGRSTAAAEIIEEKCKLQLVRPVETRWNSLFLAVQRIVRIIREQGEGAITAVCSALKIPMFTPAEIAFLTEYVKTMSPFAKAIDVLQGETSVQMGWLVPTITLLKTKLENLRLSSKFCVPLIDALQTGLERRFREMLEDSELIAAAILVPKFKTCWTSNDNILRTGLEFIKRHLKEQPIQHPSDTSNSSSEEDFFSPIKQGNAQENTKQLESYLACPDDTMDILKSFPAVCNLSLKLNTPLPASAACERLFSTAGLIFTPKRACLNSKNFENQLLLRLNKKFW
ncbi:uncharacterized protein LOC121655155 isoform X2 [Melanotaenia boesemani]|uniref:uncharacterized protein LOC121629616 isoform X2 n=1 Tax=Melanotaenia boesemani TaxID=1250792 RepID=UPI001C03C6D5|nr:uncharacterized protein LOC121629616 isoform X2 [Melanotaenia boesemani]XP_041840893.1 uncharacterized protein LOC121639620 isoform X2 [Melanotaenia boesemani]XP_041844461.1 uncharacterized protein LOC121642058 isoform X2 [Melanotaenia boesemani]XP_041845749.1 uncharacterized protein LOC121642834 isoform X2 [Melanotaenia boesemani]XP_041848467.1 uncharacterized protein LOC121644525 isoform X2 [Melanotaenia boesemani]XP_041852142.1 uncharacterized protein LOC121647061 isoform X2 [Melanotaeni